MRRGRGFFGIDRGFNSATIQLRFGDELASISLQKNHDRASIVVLMLQRSMSDDRGGDSTTKDPRSQFDRTAIAVRSDRDREVLPRIVLAV